MIKKIGILFLVGLLTGCVDEDKNTNTDVTNPPEAGTTPKAKLLELEESGAIPKLDRSDTLTGIDDNANGVRDDIEEMFARDNMSNEQLAAAMQTARALQKTLTVDTTDILAVKAVAREAGYGLDCIYSKFDDVNHSKNAGRMASEIEAMTTNTKQRLLAYLRYNGALDGTVSSLPDGDTCDE